MADTKHRRLVRVAVACVIGPVATVAIALGCITSFAAYMDVHGALAGMRIAAVGAIAVVLVPLAWWAGAALCDRIDRKAHRAQSAALRTRATATTQSSSPVRHRKVA